MKSADLEVLERALDWLDDGHQAHLFTVVQTWGSAPRLPGAVLVVRDDGHLIGSVSGGCIEDDLADKARNQTLPNKPSVLEYGISREDAQRFRIPCGGRLQIFVEPLHHSSQLLPIVQNLRERKLTKRSVHISSGEIKLTQVLPEGSHALRVVGFIATLVRNGAY